MCKKQDCCILQYWKTYRCYCNEQGIRLCMSYNVVEDGEGTPFPQPTLINSLHDTS